MCIRDRGVGSAGILSKLFPTVILGNLLAIISAGLISRIFKDSKGNGHGEILRGEREEAAAAEEIKPDYMQLGVGLIIAVMFFMIGTMLNKVFPGINAYAFIILSIVLTKAFGLLPKYYEDLSLIHISEPTRRTPISYAVFCLKKKKNTK